MAIYKNENGVLKRYDSNGGSAIQVDSDLSETSENPVQNKVVNAALKDKLGKTEQASDSATVNGHTVESNVPANAQFTDTVPEVDAELSETSTNAVQNKVVAGKFAELETDLGTVTGTVLTATLTTGETTLEITSEAIKTTSTVDLYTDVYGINPTNATVADGSLTLTFKAQTKDISVKAVIK